MRYTFLCFFIAIFLSISFLSAQEPVVDLLDSRNWKQWKIVEGDKHQLKAKPGLLELSGGPLLCVCKSSEFVDFELAAEMQADSGTIAGLLFRANERGTGQEVFIHHYDPKQLAAFRKTTGSLSGIRNVYYPLTQPGKWFNLRVRVAGGRVCIFLNGHLLVDYAGLCLPGKPQGAQYGLFAFRLYSQGRLLVRSLRVQSSDWFEFPAPQTPSDSLITALHAANFPLINYHVHLKGGLTLNQACDSAVRTGINYGIAANCGLNFPITTDSQLVAYAESMRGQPCFVAMQAEGREWVELFSPEKIRCADYVFTDAMTWTNRNGKRMRLWIPEETEIGDTSDFMEQLVGQIESICAEPIDVYVNPTYLPGPLQPMYDTLWTDARIERVIGALKQNGVALEINAKSRLPSPKIVGRAKDAGLKFTFGTNNGGQTIGDLQYCFDLITRFGLTPDDIWMPPLRK